MKITKDAIEKGIFDYYNSRERHDSMPKGRLKKRTKLKTKAKVDSNVDPCIYIETNPSRFAVFSIIRKNIVDSPSFRGGCIINDDNKALDFESEAVEESKVKTYDFSLPKIVGIGLKGVFEVIKESRIFHPKLCLRALEALYDMLQGQTPEEMKNEPSDLIDSLFEILIDLTTAKSCDISSRLSDKISSVACSCLLGLIISYGNTGKLLSALSAILIRPQSSANQQIKMPSSLRALQKSTYAVLLGHSLQPSWFHMGVQKSALISSFKVNLSKEPITAEKNQFFLACDSQYLYLHGPCGLSKIGTGFGSTVEGHVYLQKNDLYPGEKCWFGYVKGYLYCWNKSLNAADLHIIDTATLKIISTKKIINLKQSSVLFADGSNLGAICPNSDDSITMQLFDPESLQHHFEFPLKLAKKICYGFGHFPHYSLSEGSKLELEYDEDHLQISAGKDFMLMLTISGKILYMGKNLSIGIKGNSIVKEWSNIPFTFSSPVIQISVGHEGAHALIVTEEGSVYFIGLSKRGEDGDLGNMRRINKPILPKLIQKFSSVSIKFSACNNGTSAVITSLGDLFLFGSCAYLVSHCDSETGLVKNLSGVHICQVSLGKAHAIALSTKGDVYSFGINNKGQCGQSFNYGKDSFQLCSTSHDIKLMEDEGEAEDIHNEAVICAPGEHYWKFEECMVCTLCGECTGYGSDCVSKGNPARNPGMLCGCGAGESGCAVCGCCRTCGTDNESEDEIDVDPSVVSDPYLDVAIREVVRDLMVKDPQIPKIQNRIFRNASGTFRHFKQQPALQILKPLEPNVKDCDKEATKMISFAPTKVNLPIKIIEVVCGLHHTVLLSCIGTVYTFGSNSHGQLGQGDLISRDYPVLVEIPFDISKISAGSNHSILLTKCGQVLTFGSNTKGQLGRQFLDSEKCYSDDIWYSIPGLIPVIGPHCGTKATWVGANGDSSFVKIDKNLINVAKLTDMRIIGNDSCLAIIPCGVETETKFSCLTINRADGMCKGHIGKHHEDFSDKAVCLNSCYNVVFSYCYLNHEIIAYNCLASDMLIKWKGELPTILNPHLCLPVETDCSISRSEAGLSIFSLLEALTKCLKIGMTVKPDVHPGKKSKILSSDEVSYINRFESYGGGWGYQKFSYDAISFMAESDIVVAGVGLFGGRGEYVAKIKLYDLDQESGKNDTDSHLLVETDEISYECGPQERYMVYLDEPVAVVAGHWYTIWARIDGPSSDCGTDGKSIITTDDGIVFHFKNSHKCNNGTDVLSGQIPVIAYHVKSPRISASKVSFNDKVHILSREFCLKINSECFQALLELLQWSWESLKLELNCSQKRNEISTVSSVLELQKLLHLCVIALKLMRLYVDELYPIKGKKFKSETVRITECVGDCRFLVEQMLSSQLHLNCFTDSLQLRGEQDELVGMIQGLMKAVLKECHDTYISCFYVFYPTAILKWMCLSNLLFKIVQGSTLFIENEKLLCAVLAAFCHPNPGTASSFPIFSEAECELMIQRLQSASDILSPEYQTGDLNHYPYLIEHMFQRTQVENSGNVILSFKEVVDSLLQIIIAPVKDKLENQNKMYSQDLISYSCDVLCLVIADLTHPINDVSINGSSSGNCTILSTPSRFSTVNPNPTWISGTWSPDAISFSVDKPGIAIIGANIFGGTGNYEYELAILEDKSDIKETHSSFKLITSVFGTVNCDELMVDECLEIKFKKAVPIKENTKYSLVLKNKGSLTYHGDLGLASVKSVDGTIFKFFNCSLSSNGTNHLRGQIPSILYLSLGDSIERKEENFRLSDQQSRHVALSLVTSIINAANQLFADSFKLDPELASNIFIALSQSSLVTHLLPAALTHISSVIALDPKCTVQMLHLIHEIMPIVATLNNFSLNTLPTPEDNQGKNLVTTSNYYAWVESEHPYKPGSISSYRVSFPDCVKWMTIEFSPNCCTSQAEDVLQISVPCFKSAFVDSNVSQNKMSEVFWPVLKKFYGSSNWPHKSVVLPGNELLISLETASDYLKEGKGNNFGFICQVIGFENSLITLKEQGLQHLEKELAYLGGMCVSSLMRKDLSLNLNNGDESEEDLTAANSTAQEIFLSHGELLSNGLALSYLPTINQALEDILPYR